MAIDLGIDVSRINDNFNVIFDSTMTRIRRCFTVKNAAIQRIRSANTRIRASGYYHLNKVIDFQLGVYANYLEQYGKVRLPANIQEQLAQFEKSERGFVKRLFITNDRKLQNAIALLEGKFSLIHRKVSILYQVIMNQREVLRVVTYQEEGQISLLPTKDESRMIKKARTSIMSDEELQRLIRLHKSNLI